MLKSIIKEYNKTITNRDTKIVIVVITPNLNNGIKDENIKLKKPIAVVKDVIKTGIPIFSNWVLKDLNLFLYNLSELSKCMKSEIVIIKTIAGIRTITNSIPPNNIFERLNEKINEILTEIKFINTNLIFPK